VEADVRRYLNWSYKLLCVALFGYGAFVLSLAPRMPEPARAALAVAFAVLGLSIASAMAWRLWKRDDSPRWWLAEHLTGWASTSPPLTPRSRSSRAAACFRAEGTMDPYRHPVAWMTSALLVRLWAGRRFMPRRAKAPVAAEQADRQSVRGRLLGVPEKREAARDLQV